MKTRLAFLKCGPLLMALWTLTPQLTIFAQGTAFTYQGRLNDGANPASGIYDLRFTLYDAPSGGGAVGGPLTNAAALVSNGLFNVTLDFGNQFPGADRWLEIGVRTNGPGAFGTLNPRQKLSPTPYAVYAGNVSAAGISGLIADSQLSGNIAKLNGTNLIFTGAVQFNNTNNAFSGVFVGNGTGMTNVSFTSLNFSSAIAGNVFTTAATLPVGVGPGVVLAVDVNGDGKPDLVAANSGGNTLSILTNNGSGGFALSSSPVVGSGPVALVTADMNADGKPDLVTANNVANSLSILTNNGSGGFALWSSPLVGNGPVSVVAADLNGDGRMDLVSVNLDAGTLSVLVQQPGGQFVPVMSPSVGANPVGVVVMDADGDGIPDLVCANGQSTTLKVLHGTGNGIFTLATFLFPGSTPDLLISADVDGDGAPDIIYTSLTDSTLTVYPNAGLTSHLFVNGGPMSVTAADVNGDGKVDLVTANMNNTLSVFTNNGSGGFGLSASPVVGDWPAWAAAADVNGDGKTDLISANFNDNTLTVLLAIPSFSGAFRGDGSGLSALNAAALSNGTLSDARLSANVALLSRVQTFSGQNTFNNPGNSFSGDGGGLANLSAPALTGTVSDARLSGNVARLDTNQTFTGQNTFSNVTGTFSGNGAGLTSLNASQLGSGTASDARLSANVALLNRANQVFTGNNTIAAPSSLSFGTQTRQMLNLWGTLYGVGVQSSTLYTRSDGGFAWFKQGVHSDSQFDPGSGGTELLRLGDQGGLHLGGPGSELSFRNRDSSSVYVQTPANGERWVLYSRNQNGSGRLYIWSGGDKASVDISGNMYASSFIASSDRNTKESFSPVDSRVVLDKVAALPITRWNFKQDSSTAHIGPMAQDFYAAFGVGPDDKHIATVDADGVALAAIQGLNRKLEETLGQKDAEIGELKRRLERVEELLSKRHNP